jgi:hypothetical protein
MVLDPEHKSKTGKHMWGYTVWGKCLCKLCIEKVQGKRMIGLTDNSGLNNLFGLEMEK